MLLNLVQIETNTGVKEFELYQGDIVKLPFQTDLLCVSAFKNDYSPTESSIIGQFYKNGFKIEDYLKKPYLDFRNSLGVWISEKIDSTQFKRIVCLEILGNKWSYLDAIRNLFAAISTLEIQGEKNTSLVLPTLGGGDQELEANLIIETIINCSLDYLSHSRYLKKIYFIVYSDEKANLFNREMNNVLGREKIRTPKSELSNILRSELSFKIEKLLSIYQDSLILKDLKRVVNSEFRSFEFGAISRKTIEFLINQLNPKAQNQFELIKKIDSLNYIGVSQWIQSYFHIIRVFGNEAVHNKDQKIRFPEYLDEKDLEIGMYCMIKLIDFFIELKILNEKN